MGKKIRNDFFFRYHIYILLAVSFLAIFFFIITSNNIIYLSKTNMSMLCQNNADKIDDYFEDVVNDMIYIRELVERNCHDNEEVVDFIRSTENYGVFGGAYIGDDKGFYVGSTPWDIPDDYDPTTRPWFIDGKESRNFVFGEPYFDVSEGKVCISVSARIDAFDDETVRVIASDVYLDNLTTILKELSNNSMIDGAILLNTDKSMIIASSDNEYVGNLVKNSSDFYMNLVSEEVNADGNQYVVRHGFDRLYVRACTIETTNWCLIVYEKEATVLRNLYFVRIIMLIVTIISGIFILTVMVKYGEKVSLVAEKANIAKTEFISRISHDIRTPIGQVLNLTEFAKNDVDDREKLLDDLDKIESSGSFLLSLINDVLDVSQIESGRMEFHPDTYSYTDYIKDIRNITIPMCESKGLSYEFITLDEIASVPDFYCDMVRIKQITLNLISNAIKYTNKGGKITYISESREKDDDLVTFAFTIKDTGVGMTPEFMEHMFEKFSIDTSNKLRDNSQMGSGLGLYIVKSIVEQMGGDINFESRVGDGTSVSVRIDFKKAYGQNNSDAKDITNQSKGNSDDKCIKDANNIGKENIDNESQEDKTTKKRLNNDVVDKNNRADESKNYKGMYFGNVLLVEDNELNIEIAKRILEDIGLSVYTATDGVDGVNKFIDSNIGFYNIIFMDIQMPRLNGFECTRSIRNLDRSDAISVPIIAMTADAFKESKDESERAGMNAFITKPLVMKEICDILDSYNFNEKH